jgi:hypothetical protein
VTDDASQSASKPFAYPCAQLFLGQPIGELSCDLIACIHDSLLLIRHVGVINDKAALLIVLSIIFGNAIGQPSRTMLRRLLEKLLFPCVLDHTAILSRRRCARRRTASPVLWFGAIASGVHH